MCFMTTQSMLLCFKSILYIYINIFSPFFWRFNIVAPYKYMTENVKSELEIKYIYSWKLIAIISLISMQKLIG